MLRKNTRSRRRVIQANWIDLQIEEIRDHLEKRQLLERFYGWSNAGLNISQYGVGAALVTTFVSTNISAELLGVLGVVTLLCSFIQQTTKPGVKRAELGKRIVRLRNMLRRAEISLSEAKGDPAGLLHYAKVYLAELSELQKEENGIRTGTLTEAT